MDSPQCGSCDLFGVLGYPVGVMLAYFDLFLSRYVPFLCTLSNLIYTGSCNTSADTERSNNSLYVTAAIDIFSDFLGRLQSKTGSS